MKKILDIIMTSIIFTLIFFIAYKIVQSFDLVQPIKWYIYFLIGFVQTLLFRIFGRIIGIKNA